MALTSVGWEVRIFLKDQTNTTFTKIFTCDTALVTTAAEAATAAAAAIAELDPITALVIAGYTVGERFEETGTLTLPERVGYDQASILVALEDTSKFVTMYIPAPSTGIFQAAVGVQADIIDVNDADLLAYVGLFKDTTGFFLVSDGEHVNGGSTPVVSGQRISKKGGN